jgi:gamma-glutamyl-gamma-aminobutyrate hydrolase PuuD
MSYCIEKDVATVGFCRGMQMLAVVSDAPIMQDPPTFRHIPKKVLVIFDFGIAL